jgi:hypothetical protein
LATPRGSGDPRPDAQEVVSMFFEVRCLLVLYFFNT